ncbi:MAG: ABC transporter permease subunit [Trueperaceae bacterium]|nr:ABC transporter permease subunit [Trueperaceae bacterium]
MSTVEWGGFLLTLVLAGVGIAVSFPLGIALALGRRSDLPAIKWFCIAVIELVRGAPLITWLFIASLMVPLLLDVSPDSDPGALARAGRDHPVQLGVHGRERARRLAVRSRRSGRGRPRPGPVRLADHPTDRACPRRCAP